MTREEAINDLKLSLRMWGRKPQKESCEMAIRSLEAWDKVIKEMQSKKATFPTPSKESWYKEVIARNSGIDECIDIINKYLKGCDDE